MGEIASKARASSSYEEDDVVDAFSEQRICVCNLQHICFKQNNNRALSNAVNGLIPIGDIAQTFLEKTSEFKFERLSSTRGKVTRLSDGNEIEFNDGEKFTQHDGKEVHMYMQQVIEKKTKAAQYPIFGTEGNEVWYGGKTTYDDTRLSLVWDDVETKTPERRTDNQHIRWPFGNGDKSSNLVLITIPFSNDEINNLLEPQYVIDGNGDYKWEAVLDNGSVDVTYAQEAPEQVDRDDKRDWRKVVHRKRRNKVNNTDNLLSSLGISRDDLRDPRKVIDKREQMTALSDTDGFFDKLNNQTRQKFKENRTPGGR